MGARILEERQRQGWSQQVAATAIGVSREMWAKYEKGAEPGAKALARMLAAGIDVLYVLTGERTAPEQDTLSPRERALVDNYRHTHPDQRKFIEQAAVITSELQPARAVA